MPANELRPAAAVAIRDNYNATYELKISREVFAHACTLYGAYRGMFPAAFQVNPDDHLDFFIWWYDGQIFTNRHIKPELDNTLGVIDRDMTIDTLAGALAENADEVARFNQGIVQFANVAILRQ